MLVYIIRLAMTFLALLLYLQYLNDIQILCVISTLLFDLMSEDQSDWCTALAPGTLGNILYDRIL